MAMLNYQMILKKVMLLGLLVILITHYITHYVAEKKLNQPVQRDDREFLALLIRRGFWELRRERYVLMLRIEKKNNQASVKKGDLRIYKQ